jgi:hypothetical protein
LAAHPIVNKPSAAMTAITMRIMDMEHPLSTIAKN